MENDQPLVTVNILSYNRKDELRNTLQKVYEQDYENIEVIVVDNASSDGSPEMVDKEFPGAKLIKLEKNIGIAGWNEGFVGARGNTYCFQMMTHARRKIQSNLPKLKVNHFTQLQKLIIENCT